MALEPFKFIVQGILLDKDDDGNVIGERECRPVVLYGSDALQKWAEDFDDNLAKAKTEDGNAAGQLVPSVDGS